MSEHIVPVRVYILIFLTLLFMTALTVWVAFHDFGAFNTPIAIAIACLKGFLVVLYFMHVRYGSSLTKFLAGAGIGWLLILLVIVIAEWASRAWEHPPQGWM